MFEVNKFFLISLTDDDVSGRLNVGILNSFLQKKKFTLHCIQFTSCQEVLGHILVLMSVKSHTTQYQNEFE